MNDVFRYVKSYIKFFLNSFHKIFDVVCILCRYIYCRYMQNLNFYECIYLNKYVYEWKAKIYILARLHKHSNEINKKIKISKIKPNEDTQTIHYICECKMYVQDKKISRWTMNFFIETILIARTISSPFFIIIIFT